MKNNLSRYLTYVQRGGRVTVFNRDVPVAELIPVGTAGSEKGGPLDAHLHRLEREGVVRRGTGHVPPELRNPPRGKPSGVLDALLEERATGR